MVLILFLHILAACDSAVSIFLGLFDHFLNKQDDLGSVVDTNAAIQYRAAMAINGQTQVCLFIYLKLFHFVTFVQFWCVLMICNLIV